MTICKYRLCTGKRSGSLLRLYLASSFLVVGFFFLPPFVPFLFTSFFSVFSWTKFAETTVVRNHDARKIVRSLFMALEMIYQINRHLIPELEDQQLRDIHRSALQDILERKAADGLSFTVVTHLRWDLRHIFRVAVAEGVLTLNPAELLFTPQTATRTVQRVATADEVRRAFAAVGLWEKLILKLAGISGMRPGEIFGLKWASVEPGRAVIRQRTYRGDIDTPKSPKSVRKAALSQSTRRTWNNGVGFVLIPPLMCGCSHLKPG